MYELADPMAFFGLSVDSVPVADTLASMLGQQQDEITRHIETQVVAQMKETQQMLKNQNDSLFKAFVQFQKDNQEQWRKMSDRIALLETQLLGAGGQGETMRNIMETVQEHVEELWEAVKDPTANADLSSFAWQPSSVRLAPARWGCDDNTLASSEGEVNAIVSTHLPLPGAAPMHPSTASSYTPFHEHFGDLPKDSVRPEEAITSVNKDPTAGLFPGPDFTPTIITDISFTSTAAASVSTPGTDLFFGSNCSSPLSSAPPSDDEDDALLPDPPKISILQASSLKKQSKQPDGSRRRASTSALNSKRPKRESGNRRASTSASQPSKRKRSRSTFGARSTKRSKPSHPPPAVEEPSMGNVIACDGCDNWFHYACVGISYNDPVVTDPDEQYICKYCKTGEPLPKPPSEEFICIPLNCKFNNRKFMSPDESDSPSAEYIIECFVGRHRRPSLRTKTEEWYLVKWDYFGIEYCQWKSAWSFPYSIVGLMKTFERAAEKEGLDLQTDYLLLPEAAEYSGPWTDEVVLSLPPT